MGDLDKNIHRKEKPSPYEEISVNPIEKDKQGKEGGYASLKNATRTQILATLVSCFKKLFSAFPSKIKLSLHSQQNLLKNILSFRQLLITLSKEDQSHNPHFTEQLTTAWHALTEDCHSLSHVREGPSEILEKLNALISNIQHFPPGADHSLGYYFNEYAGSQWIPFPFMELLQDLHNEYTASPVISVLQHWIFLLNDILPTEKTGPPSG
jgi:hypothetical protein